MRPRKINRTEEMNISEIKRHLKLSLKRIALSNKATRSLYKRRRDRLDKALRFEYFNSGPKVASLVDSLLTEVNINVWLYAGSLLGVVRDGDFLPWDNDLDLCVVENEQFKWGNLEKALVSAGFEKIREFQCNGNITEQAYAFGNSHFDVFAVKPMDGDRAQVCIYLKENNVWYADESHWTVMRLDTFLPKGKTYVDVRGYPLPIPENSEQLLEKQYGPSWRIPDPDYIDGTTYRILDGAEGRSTVFLR